MSLFMSLDDEPADTLGVEPRLARGDRDQPMDDDDEGRANVELAFIMTAASNPVSPGPSSPPLSQTHIQDFVPPTRPSSTPFPQPEPRSTDLRCASGGPCEWMMDLDTPDPAGLPSSAPPASQLGVGLDDLPAEITECILDHLFGFRVSTQSKSSIMRWGTALRHPRRKELSEFALVSPTWRVLIQERLYRHIKLKATLDSLSQAIVYFANHAHLRSYIRHIEIWFPVFQPRYGPLALSTASTLPTVTIDGLTNASYILPADNCSLEEAFYFVAETFPQACILTLEGGERKKAPKVRHRIRHQEEPVRPMPQVHSIRTLVCKGQWNLIRSGSDFDAIMSALPSLREWHGNYTKPKSKSYITMAEILGKPLHLSTLNLCIEADYRRETACPRFFRKVWEKAHLCPKLAQAVASPSMERVSYTGRICGQFLQELVARQADPRQARLKSIDLSVKNFCRHGALFELGSGITDMNFIAAFEAFVLKAIRSLNKLPNVDYLRIRYVDLGMQFPSLSRCLRTLLINNLDSPIPPLNPYFMMRNGVCSGVWSDDILTELARARPAAQFEELADTVGALTTTKDGRVTIVSDFPKSRVKSIKMSTYSLLQPNLAANPAGPTIF